MRTTTPLFVTCLGFVVGCQAEVSASAGGGTTAANSPTTTSTPSTSSGTSTNTGSASGSGNSSGSTATTNPTNPTTTTATNPPPVTTNAASYGAIVVKLGGTPAADPDPPANAHTMQIAIADGRPAGLASGAPEAYWIWRDGTSWHLRTTTKSQLHKFRGWVGAESFSDITASKLEVADKVHASNKIIQFEFATAGYEDGIDFKVPADDCVRFHLHVDDKQEPAIIHIGASGAHPQKAHFKMCPDGKMGAAVAAVKPNGPDKDKDKDKDKKDDKKEEKHEKDIKKEKGH